MASGRFVRRVVVVAPPWRPGCDPQVFMALIVGPRGSARGGEGRGIGPEFAFRGCVLLWERERTKADRPALAMGEVVQRAGRFFFHSASCSLRSALATGEVVQRAVRLFSFLSFA